ncbi:MAG TPA: ATP-dependent helicase HrpB, partial [Hyphomonas sp.]|nr:ATP-dependent helicase HrpB [Hyphomonas sp.]
MQSSLPSLPIDDVLAEICAGLRDHARLVLAAPPGAGKTTRVPLALAGLLGEAPIIEGKIIMLEPRRIAARMAAQQMANSLGEKLGQSVGLTTRVDRKVSAATRVEVITDGLFTRRILSDPELAGVGAVIFDEFHERRLNSDLGLTLAMEAQGALRDDLRILIMSATLDTEKVSSVLGAPVVESQGRQYPVESKYLGRSQDRIEDRMAAAVRKALREEEGSILAFLPGAREIQRTAEQLETVPDNVRVAPLFGALSPAEQDAAVSPAPEGMRKIVLATDIAESALTIEGVRIVIDSGLSRVAEEAAGGLGTRLSTVKASRASVDQRRGRAGRLSPGVCYRLWDEAATRGLMAAPVPEILKSDLSGLVLTLAEWGERDATRLTWMDAPPAGRLKAAQELLSTLGAIDETGALTVLGSEMA